MRPAFVGGVEGVGVPRPLPPAEQAEGEHEDLFPCRVVAALVDEVPERIVLRRIVERSRQPVGGEELEDAGCACRRRSSSG